MEKLGVIDLGTNTFHLLVAEVNENQVKEIYRERVFVKLAEQGIATIGDAAYKRATDAIAKFKSILEALEVTKVKAFGTAGLRTASNGPDFVKMIQEQYNLTIDVISGNEEARLIHKGVMRAIGQLDNRSLIMDIGGGSVEFIIADNEQIYWAKSFKIGVAVLFNRFQKNDPITTIEIKEMHQFFDTELSDLKSKLLEFSVHSLIGASGTFDVLENIVVENKTNPLYSTFPVQRFHEIHDKYLFSSLSERIANDKIPNDRAELIIVAFVLLQYIAKLTNIQNVIVSSYAMKEGILSEMVTV